MKNPSQHLKPTTLSKSRFVMALECPRKLDYARDPRYYDSKTDNDMLASLAEGGFQVGELARRMFPGGILIDVISQHEQIRQTEELLKRPEVTLFEATIKHGNLLVRVDVLEKKGNKIRLLEVKAKGFNPDEDRFVTRRGAHPILSGWRPYLYDVAFQTHVLSLAHPAFHIAPYLMLLDKRQTVGIDGLCSMFAVNIDGRNVSVSVADDFDVAKLDPPLLAALDVSEAVRKLHAHPIEAPGIAESFAGFVDRVAGDLEVGASLPVTVNAKCKNCQYYVEPDEAGPDRLSGWTACMTEHAGLPWTTRRAETVFGLYGINGKALERHLASEEPLKLADLSGLDTDDSDPSVTSISADHRRHLQIGEARGKVTEPFVLGSDLDLPQPHRTQPLHFLDFETARPALPYHRGRKPYDLLLFQFSHHVLHSDGRIEHRSQFLQTDPGIPPSLETVRALKSALGGDSGAIIHWWSYEATVLKEIRRQIEAAPPDDAADLITFIDGLIGTSSTPGRLYDLAKPVSRHVFYPGTGGSSSIKKVLPAVLRYSETVRRRFQEPIYGTAVMPSHNFKDWQWVRMRDGSVIDPYELLDPLLDLPALDQVIGAAAEDDGEGSENFISNGGAAMLAYDLLQGKALPHHRRAEINRQLLRYCELDTLATILVYAALPLRPHKTDNRSHQA